MENENEIKFVTCALCGREIPEEEAEYGQPSNDKAEPYCHACFQLDEEDIQPETPPIGPDTDWNP